MEINTFNCGDVLRMQHYPTCGGFRCWKVIGVHSGAVKQEGTYELLPLDVTGNEPIQVPCLILETHPGITRV